MTDLRNGTGGYDDLPEDAISEVYGSGLDEDAGLAASGERNRDFKPWHHPVKQIVRDQQWAALTVKLLEHKPALPAILRYFTLPGPDMLDVQVLADVCSPRGVKIDYFGFDSRADDESRHGSMVGTQASTTESALRQAGRITDGALIMPDRLEDIARADSQAAELLRRQLPFDVINIDACDHLAYSPRGRERCTFDALRTLLSHQMEARSQWLLFITTRAAPDLLGNPGLQMQQAITANLHVARESFGQALAAAIEAEAHLLGSALSECWNKHDMKFLKLYSIGLGKFLLQFFHGQPNHPAKVELASAYAYRVHADIPDMLALAFRITPDQRRIYDPIAGGAALIPNLEPERAVQVASRASKLMDIDHALESEPDVRRDAVAKTIALLKAANYDVDAWTYWLATHERRPMVLGAL